ncbi:MAG TPA: endonuclease/exonuclease/phosphatase family protein [Thermoanaerobaculia bacterium]|nr:endonuclease/exonuclease/phosphatase family protein [Thermoanaerobaculia bacterium]
MLRHLAIALFALLAACVSAPPDRDTTLQVMTFNIRLNLASDGPNAWPHRKDAVANLIRSADLVGLQEALPEQLADLDALIPHFGRIGAGRAADRRGEASAILYRRDRFEVLRQETFWLSETPDVAGSKGWDAAYERIATWGEFRDRTTGVRFFHFNTHLDHVGAMARREGTRLLLRAIARIAAPEDAVMLTGDFNAPPDSAPYRQVIDAGFEDAFHRSRRPHEGPDSTWNGFKAIEPGRRIDFIFVRNAVEVLRHEIADTMMEGGRFPSDHLPVMAELRIRRR